MGAGQSYVVFGNSKLNDVDVNSLDGSNGFTIKVEGTGVALPNGIGGSVVSVVDAGDLDGDDLDDIAINTRGVIGGRNYIVFGRERLIGDCNFNDVIEISDLTCVADLEGRDAVLVALKTLPGDINGDGKIALDDFLVLQNNFGEDPAVYPQGDIDLQ